MDQNLGVLSWIVPLLLLEADTLSRFTISSLELKLDEEDDEESPLPLLIVHDDCVPPLLWVMTGLP